MSSDRSKRADLLAALDRELRRTSGLSVLLSQAIAERLQMSPTDLECLGFLSDEGPLPAGRLAELTGLTTGAITGVIDRLERAGYVRRVADPTDRRRVIVQPVHGEATRRIAALYEPLMQAQAEVSARYTDQELELILGYLQRSSKAVQDEVARLREATTVAQDKEGKLLSVPLGAVSSGHLIYAARAARVTIRSDAKLADLFRGRFEPSAPSAVVSNGTITIGAAEGTRSTLSSWLGGASEITLNRSVPWDLDLRLDASRLNAELRDLELLTLRLGGDASRFEVRLDRPTGAVPITIGGSAGKVALRYPSGTIVRVRDEGSANSVKVKDRSLEMITRRHWESPSFASAADRFDVTVHATASTITLEAS